MSEMQQYCELTCCSNGFLDIDAPTNLLTREVTEDSALVTWDKVQADIDGYMLSYSSLDGSAQEVRVAADSASYRFTALKPGVLYTVYVWAVKGPRSSRKATTEAETGYLIQAGSVALRPCFLLLPKKCQMKHVEGLVSAIVISELILNIKLKKEESISFRQ